MCLICTMRDLMTPDPIIDQSAQEHQSELDAQLAKGREFVSSHATIDIHAHPGRFFVRSDDCSDVTRLLGPANPQAAIQALATGGVGAVVFALVADHCLLGLSDFGLRAIREFEEGEAFAEYSRQMAALDEMLALMRDERDLAKFHPYRSVEGGDFIENRLDRIAEASARGVCSVTLIHYHTNQIGDTQTEADVHAGLTSVGRDIIREMEAHRVLVDLSHASFATARDAVEMATRPMILSHSNIRRGDQTHPRLISLEHARMVAEAGGLVGAVPAGFGQSSFSDYIDTICYMVDVLGVDHVAVGTDMDYTYNPVMTDYRQWPRIPGALLARGFAQDEVSRILGANFARLLNA